MERQQAAQQMHTSPLGLCQFSWARWTEQNLTGLWPKPPSWGAAGLSPQHPHLCQMLLEQWLAKEPHTTHNSCTPEGPILTKTAQLWHGHSFSKQISTWLDIFMVNLCKSKVEFSLKCTQRSPLFSNDKIFLICRIQKYLIFLPSRGQYNTGLCYEAWLQAKSFQEEVTKAFIKKERFTKLASHLETLLCQYKFCQKPPLKIAMQGYEISDIL